MCTEFGGYTIYFFYKFQISFVDILAATAAFLVDL